MFLLFQSTHPSWGATRSNHIHEQYVQYFNPRTHRGVRHNSWSTWVSFFKFQSTHPSWGATSWTINDSPQSIISIHAPIVGCDILDEINEIHMYNFNPRTHRGVRQSCSGRNRGYQEISIHAPIVGCDAKIAKFLLEFHYFWQIHITIFTELW